MSLVNADMQAKRWFIQKNAVKKFRGNAFDTPLGMAFYIHNFDSDNSPNLVQISFKSYLKNWKKFFKNFKCAVSNTPPSYAILYSKIREKLFLKFAPDFVQICSEKLMKNFNRLKCFIRTSPAVVRVYFDFTALLFALYGGFIASV